MAIRGLVEYYGYPWETVGLWSIKEMIGELKEILNLNVYIPRKNKMIQK